MLAFLLFEPKPFIGGDNYWYMVLAESFRSGEGYRDLWLPGAPPHTRFPPVYPLLLATVGALASSVLIFKLISLAFTTAAVGLTTSWVSRRAEAPLPLMAGLVVSVLPALVEYSHWVLSEPAFTFFIIFTLLALARDDRGSPGTWFFLAVSGSVLATLTRSAGLPLILAVALHLGVRRRWSRLGIFLAVVCLALGAWWLRSRWVGSTDIPYSEWMLFRDPYRPSLGTVTLGELFARVVQNLGVYTTAIWPQSLGGRDLNPGLAGAVGIVTAFAVAAAAVRRLRRLEAPELFFFGYLALIFVWPEAWTDQRLLLPLLPLTGSYLIEAVFWAWGALGTKSHVAQRAVRPAVVTASVCVLFAGFGTLRGLGPHLECASRYWRGDRYACYPAPFVDFLETAAWTREHTEPDAIVVNRKPQIFYWVSGRRGDIYPFTTNGDSVIRFLDALDARYVVVDNLSATTYRYLVPAIQRYANRFRVIHRRGGPPTYLLSYTTDNEE